MLKQHLIDPEVCIRCNTCEATCPIGAITHDANNYVVDASVCNFCMDCVSPCPTGSIDNWFMVSAPFGIEDQFSWQELPPRVEEAAVDAIDEEAAALLDEAHARAGGRARAPVTASKPRINVFNRAAPAVAVVAANIAATEEGTVRHIVLDFGAVPFPVLEGQSVGVVPPGVDAHGKPHAMRLYSIASARDGERPNTNTLALTVKRMPCGVASGYLCDLTVGAKVAVVGPFGSTFLMPDDPEADIVMICTGTGAAPFRGFTERRRRTSVTPRARLLMFFGGRTPEELPYLKALRRVPEAILDRELVYSRLPGAARQYVQDRMRSRGAELAGLLRKPTTHVFVCGLRGLEEGVEAIFSAIGAEHGMDWAGLRGSMLAEGRYHAETY